MKQRKFFQVNSTETPHQKDLKHVAVGGLVNMLNVLGALAVPALHALIVWAFGPVIYGLYAVGTTCAEVGSKLATLGSDKGLLRAIPAQKISGKENEVSDSLWTAFISVSLTSVVLGLLMFFLAERLSPLFGGNDYSEAIAWMSPVLGLIALTNVFVSATLAAKLVRFNLLVRGFAQPFLLILLAAIFSLKPSLQSLMMGVVIAFFLTALIGAWTIFKVFKKTKRFQFQKDLIKFSFPLGISEFLNIMLHRASLLILAFYVSPLEMAAYAACEMLVRAVAGVRNAFDPILSPVISEALQENDFQRVEYNLKLTTRWVIALAVPVISAFVFFGREILEVIDPQFKSAALILSALSFGYALNSTLGLNGWVLTMAGHSWLLLINNGISALTNVVLALILIPRYGILGGAIATSVGVIVMVVLVFIQVAWMKKIQPLSWASARIILVGALSLILLLWLSPQLPENGLMRIFLGMTFFFIAYLILWRLLAFEKEDQHLLGKILKRSASK